MTKEREWICTSKAAEIAGYCPGHFRRKFLEAFIRQGGVFFTAGGHVRWELVLVKQLRIIPTDPGTKPMQ